MHSTDEKLKKDVVDSLYWDSRVDASRIKVDVADGKVTLTGTLSDHTAIQAAESDVWTLSGVKTVVNRLKIHYPADITSPEDHQIKAFVEQALSWDSTLKSENIFISVVKGRIKLEGTVDALWKKFKAEDLIRDIAGVEDVVNELSVVPSRKAEDTAIAESIVAAMDRNAYLVVNQVNVKVQEGEVTLSGTVRDRLAYRIAVDIVRLTAGVKHIINNLHLA
jgi:osmotically-inducible protein OsmY